ncbi:hypothetical protein [Bartonella sp. MM73XJBT]|uniref:hypothetical protein n=1 Tax=Bartonella sp. MM73XJBT TaxID=3019095 RepID=UPI002360309B|nr:hypothetical protein [Bartonella sp. MM73XJBT]
MKHKPWAVILFARNIGAADDIKAPITSLREVSGRDDIFIDQKREEYTICYLTIQLLQH